MDWPALTLSFKLASLTVLCLLPLGIFVGRWLAYASFRGKSLLQALLAVPLVLPPTVFGYYLLVSLGAPSVFGQVMERVLGHSLLFSFEGLLLASILFNIPFAIQPIQRAFESIPRNIREAAACCGMAQRHVLVKIELPLAWPGIVSAMVMTFAHTLGEFGIVLMVGGNIPGETQTIAIAIYDRVQAFDNHAAAIMSLCLLIFSMLTILIAYGLSDRHKHNYG